MKAFHARKHLERSQPSSRAKYGLLEKKSDYKLRSADYHRKQNEIKRLTKKAKLRNEDEYYHRMNREKGKKNNEELDFTTIALLKSQDEKYVKYYRDVNRKKMERIESEIQVISSVGSWKGSHVRYSGSEESGSQVEDLTAKSRAEETLSEENPLAKELSKRKLRHEALVKVEHQMHKQTLLMKSKGKVTKKGDVYKWRQERAR